MRWGEAAQTDRDTDLIIDEEGRFGPPIGLMLSPELDPNLRADLSSGSRPRQKIIQGKWSPADDVDQADDQSISWTDWSLGLGFGRLDRSGRGGYSWGIGIDARDPRRVMPAGAVQYIDMPSTSSWSQLPIRGFQQFGSDVYAVTGLDDSTQQTGASAILRVVNSVGPAVVSGYFQADTNPYFSGRSITQYRGNLYVGGYNGFMRRKMNVFNSPEAGPLDDTVPGDGVGWNSYAHQRIFMAKQTWKVAGIKDYYLVANDTESSMVYTTADPTIAGNWSSPTGIIQGDTLLPTHIGDDRHRIVSIGYSNGRLVWGKTDGAWDVDSTGTAANMTPYIEDTYNRENMTTMFYHDGHIWFWSTLGYQRINLSDRVRVDVPQIVQPGYGRAVDGPIFGQVTAQTEDSGWIVIAIYNGTDSFILYGQDPAALGLDVNVPIIWHGAFAHFPNRRVTAFGKTTLSPSIDQQWPMLFIALWDPDEGTVEIAKMYRTNSASAYQMWQAGRATGEYNFCLNWSMNFTSEDIAAPNTRKALLRGDVTSENVSTARKLEVYTAMDSTVYADEDSNGHLFFTLTPPISNTFVLAIYGYGVTGDIDHDATAPEIQSALEAIPGIIPSNINVAIYGNRTFRITLIDLPSTAVVTVTGPTASMAYHLQGSALTAPRQAFLPAKTTPTGFNLNVRVDGTGGYGEPAILTGVKYRVSMIEDQLEEKEYTVRIGTGVTNRMNIQMTNDPVALVARLISYMNRGAIQYIDESGRKVSGKLRQGIQYVKIEDDGGWYLRVTFRVKIQKQPFYWNGGATWGDVYSFS